MTLAATVVVPTTGDRGPLLPYSVGSVLRQSVPDIEVFVIGDGAGESTCEVVRDLAREDGRVRLFAHPKHPRRGEVYRHAALAEARGEIVCYLTDRDYMLPNHVETLRGLLRNADFAHTLRFAVESVGFTFPCMFDINSSEDREAMRRLRLPVDVPLSTAGHTLRFYRSLPHGWRTTPAYVFTDGHMWHQMLCQPECRTATSTLPTVLYFKRGDFPGWSVDRRLALLEEWHQRVQRPGWYETFVREVHAAAIRDRARLARLAQSASRSRLRAWLLGHPRIAERVFREGRLVGPAKLLGRVLLGRNRMRG